MALWGANGKLTPSDADPNALRLGSEFLAVLCLHLHHTELGDPSGGPVESELATLFALDATDLVDLAALRAAVIGKNRSQITTFCAELERTALQAYNSSMPRWEYTAQAPFTSVHELHIHGRTITASGATAGALGAAFVAAFQAEAWNPHEYPFPRAVIEGSSLAVYNAFSDFQGSAGALMTEVGFSRKRLISGAAAKSWMGL